VTLRLWRGLDRNAVVNPEHPDARRIDIGPERPAYWDPRLARGG
jgi:hypothetical protein